MGTNKDTEKVCHAEFLVIAVVPRNRDRGRQLEARFKHVSEHHNVDWPCFKRLDLRWLMMILLLLFLQKQSLAFAVYLFGISTLHTGPGLKKKTHVIMLSP
jgi:hypothetical protein